MSRGSGKTARSQFNRILRFRVPEHDRKRDLIAVAGLALLLTILFADILFLGNTLYFRDIAREYYPTRRIFHDIVRGGEFPLWNPRYAAGQPFAANPGYEVFYPVAWLTLLIPNFDLGFRLEVLLHYYLAAIAMFAFLRSCRATPAAALLGATSWSVGGMLLSLSNLLPFLFSAAWLPLLALFVRRWLIRRGRSDFAAAALALGMILLVADQSMILQAGALAAAYALYRALRTSQSVSRAILGIALLCLAALAVGAAQIAPAFDFQPDSGRAAALPRSTAMQWSMAPVRPLELVFPTLFGHFTPEAPFFWARRLTPPFSTPFILSIYPGLIVAALFVAGLAGRTRGWRFAAFVVPISYLVAIGSSGPVFPLLYAAGMRGIRYPEKFWISGMFVLTVFASLAFDERERLGRGLTVFLGTVAAVATAVTAIAFTPIYKRVFDLLWHLPGSDEAVRASRTTWPVMAAVAAAWIAVFVFRTRVPQRTWLALCGALLLADLVPRAAGLMPRMPPAFATPPPVVARLAIPPAKARIFNQADWTYFFGGAPSVPYSVGPWVVRNSLSPRSFASWGVNGVIDLDITGTDLRPTREFTGLLMAIGRRRPDRVPLLRRMTGATHVIEALPMHDWHGRDLEELEPVAVKRLPDGEPFYFADDVVPIRGGPDFAARLLGPAPFSLRTAFVEAPFTLRPQPGARQIRASVRANSMDFVVETAAPALFVLAVTPHRYWHATLDGRPTQLIRTNIAYQSVVVPPGRHTIAMAYRNPVVIASLTLSILATIALGAVAVFSRRTSREAVSPAGDSAGGPRNTALPPPSPR